MRAARYQDNNPYPSVFPKRERKGISASSIAIELVYKRLNKAHNNKLSIYDLSNELTSI